MILVHQGGRAALTLAEIKGQALDYFMAPSVEMPSHHDWLCLHGDIMDWKRSSPLKFVVSALGIRAVT